MIPRRKINKKVSPKLFNIIPRGAVFIQHKKSYIIPYKNVLFIRSPRQRMRTVVFQEFIKFVCKGESFSVDLRVDGSENSFYSDTARWLFPFFFFGRKSFTIHCPYGFCSVNNIIESSRNQVQSRRRFLRPEFDGAAKSWARD